MLPDPLFSAPPLLSSPSLRQLAILGKRINFTVHHLQILAKRDLFEISPSLLVSEITARQLIALADKGYTAQTLGYAGEKIAAYFQLPKKIGRPRKPDAELKRPRQDRSGWKRRPAIPRHLRGKNIWFWRGEWRLR